jgi:hypothetical protein
LVDAAHLAAGVEPKDRLDLRPISESGDAHPKTSQVKAIIEAMQKGLNDAFGNISRNLFIQKSERNVPSGALNPIEIAKQLNAEYPCFSDHSEFESWLANLQFLLREGHLIFDRAELHRWFAVNGNGFKPEFEFVPAMVPTIGTADQSLLLTVNELELEIDPADLPAELDAANVAFRALTNGY